jgi:type VI secretion system secreted protein VgrG
VSDQNREYLIAGATYDIEDNAYESTSTKGEKFNYQANWTVIPSSQPYRPQRVTPKPVVKGPQTAVVVGKEGEEIWTDEYGRVKVQFHWDRYGELNEHSSCWIRVAHVWAGKSFGAIHIPRIGQEVIVHFLEGDPDQPIVVGRVYNGDLMPPYALPDHQTQSGIKTHSTKEGDAETFNELRFEDKKDEEEIYFHAEKDFVRVVENNDSLSVGFEKQDEGNQTIDIYNNRTVTIDQGNDKLQVKTGDRDVIIDSGDDTHHVKEGDRVVNVDQGDDTLTVGQGDLSINIDAGKGTIEAAQSLELKVGGSSIKIEPSKITLSSPQIELSADGQLEASAAMVQISGDGVVEVSGGVIQLN